MQDPQRLASLLCSIGPLGFVPRRLPTLDDQRIDRGIHGLNLSVIALPTARRPERRPDDNSATHSVAERVSHEELAAG